MPPDFLPSCQLHSLLMPTGKLPAPLFVWFLSFQPCFLFWEVEAPPQGSGLASGIGWTFTKSAKLSLAVICEQKKVAFADFVEGPSWDPVYQNKLSLL